MAERRRLTHQAEEAWTRASGALDNLPPRFAELPLLLIEGEWTAARALAVAATPPNSRTSRRPFATSLLACLAREQGHPELAALARRTSGPGYCQQLARSLRAFARRIDPTCGPAAGRATLVPLPQA